jgi:signal transduction histidine kinase
MDDALTVRVVDRGCGFDTAMPSTGFGLPWSVVARMRAVGGGTRVLSAPGDGTTVQLTWPA